MTKTIEQYFADWESNAFGFGYGTGEPHTLAALKGFFGAMGRNDNPDAYDYRTLEAALTPTVAWLMINALCREDVIEYGTSSRGGWLTPTGKALKTFVDSKSTLMERTMTLTDAELETELVKLDEFTRAFHAMPIRHQVAWWRPKILNRCRRWRKHIKDGMQPSRDGISPLDMLRWEQSRLAEMRAWRATGIRRSVH